MYILVMAYVICAMSATLVFSTLRTNFFTFLPASSFSRYRCEWGYLLFYFLFFLSFCILFTVFVFKIWLIFRRTAYKYPPWIYKLMIVVILSNFLAAVTDRVLRVFVHDDWVWTIETVPLLPGSDYELTICLLLKVGGTDSVHFLVATYYVLVTNVFINVALLFMFNRGLWLLRQETLLMILNERMKSHSDDTEHGTHGDDNGGDDAPSSPNQNGNDSNRPTLSIRNPEAEIERMSSTKKSILRLHNLIKKQTILVCIALASTTMLAVVSTLDGSGIAITGWDTTVNALCVWLMLGLSKQYWNCCSRYGLCHCCYLNDDQNRVMMMLERSPTASSFGRSPTTTEMASTQ